MPAQVYAALAGVEDWLGRRELGLSHITQAVNMDPHSKQVVHLNSFLGIQQSYKHLFDL